MYWILFVMGALVAVITALIAGGLATPRTHVAARSMVVRAPVDEVWRTIRTVSEYAAWRSEITESVESIGDDGPEWRESRRRSAVRFGITLDDPPRRFGARILDDDLPYTGEWQWQLEPTDGGTRVTITERGEVGNPIFRFIGTQMTGHTKTIDAYLVALATKLGDAGASVEDA